MGKGQNFLNMGKNNAKIFELDPLQKVSFKDVAGIDEVVDEVKEVDFIGIDWSEFSFYSKLRGNTGICSSAGNDSRNC